MNIERAARPWSQYPVRTTPTRSYRRRPSNDHICTSSRLGCHYSRRAHQFRQHHCPLQSARRLASPQPRLERMAIREAGARMCHHQSWRRSSEARRREALQRYSSRCGSAWRASKLSAAFSRVLLATEWRGAAWIFVWTCGRTS
jgi:hypothetical protein